MVLEDQLEELLARLGVFTEHAQHGAGDGLAGGLLDSAHGHAHVAVRNRGVVANEQLQGAPERGICYFLAPNMLYGWLLWPQDWCISTGCKSTLLVQYHLED